jgi:hypothetical protein
MIETRARICKHLRSAGIDSKESIPPAYVAWWAGTTNRVVKAGNRYLGSLKGYKYGFRDAYFGKIQFDLRLYMIFCLQK